MLNVTLSLTCRGSFCPSPTGSFPVSPQFQCRVLQPFCCISQEPRIYQILPFLLYSMLYPLLSIFSPEYLLNLSAFCHLYHTTIIWISMITLYLWLLIHFPQSGHKIVSNANLISSVSAWNPSEMVRIKTEILIHTAWEALHSLASFLFPF